jgi:hypothetical protein
VILWHGDRRAYFVADAAWCQGLALFGAMFDSPPIGGVGTSSMKYTFRSGVGRKNSLSLVAIFAAQR